MNYNKNYLIDSMNRTKKAVGVLKTVGLYLLFIVAIALLCIVCKFLNQ